MKEYEKHLVREENNRYSRLRYLLVYTSSLLVTLHLDPVEVSCVGERTNVVRRLSTPNA